MRTKTTFFTVFITITAAPLSLAMLGPVNSPALASVSFGKGQATVVSQPLSRAALVAAMAPATASGALGAVTLNYSATISDNLTCEFTNGFDSESCDNATALASGNQDVTSAYSGSITASVPITTTDDLRTPGTGTGHRRDRVDPDRLQHILRR